MIEHAAAVRLADLVALSWVTAEYERRRGQIARDRERKRIADALHDHVAQLLFATKTRLDILRDHSAWDDDVGSGLEVCRGQVLACELAIREVVDALSPAGVATADLDERFALMAQGVEDEFDIAVVVRSEVSGTGAAEHVSGRLIDAAMRAAREALVNAAKHAGPCRITAYMGFEQARGLLIRVADTGIGRPESAAAGYGLGSVERDLSGLGGEMQVMPGPSGGTEVLVIVPPDC
jgi:signal transduction histidine kinase